MRRGVWWCGRRDVFAFDMQRQAGALTDPIRQRATGVCGRQIKPRQAQRRGVVGAQRDGMQAEGQRGRAAPPRIR